MKRYLLSEKNKKKDAMAFFKRLGEFTSFVKKREGRLI